MIMRKLVTIQLLTLATAFVACDSSDEAVFKDDGNFEEKPKSIFSGPGGEAALEEAEEEEVVKAADLTYRIFITTASEAELCAGKIELELMSNFSMKFPTAVVKCSSMTIDLGTLLSSGIGGGGEGAASGFGGGDGKALPIVHEDGILKFKEIANTTFDPPRPFLLGPIINDSSKYKDFEYSVQSSATTKSGKSGNGTFNVKVLDHKTTYTNEYMEKKGHDKFKNILHWTLKTNGFDGFKAADGVIVEKFEWKWNTKPLMIPEITIEGEMGDLMQMGEPGAPDDGLANDFVGLVTIKLMVEDYKEY
jgi:hypothetical protein